MSKSLCANSRLFRSRLTLFISLGTSARFKQNYINRRMKLGGKGKTRDGRRGSGARMFLGREMQFAIPFQPRLRRKERIPNVHLFTRM